MRRDRRDNANPADWIGDFLAEVGAALDPPAWLEPGDPHYELFAATWVDAFRGDRVTESEARAALIKLGGCPPRSRREYLPAVRKLVDLARPRRAQPDESRRDAASASSKDCPHCGGSGFGIVWHPAPCHAERIPEAIPAYCKCPLGRWIKATHAAKSPDASRQTPDMVDVEAGREVWQIDPPRWESAEARRLAIFGTEPTTPKRRPAPAPAEENV